MVPTGRSADKLKATTMVTRANANRAPILDEWNPPEPIMPAVRIPKKVISAMVAAGAKKEQLRGESLCILRVKGVDSGAWNLYEEWASSLGEVDPLVLTNYAPTLDVLNALRCPPNALVGDILDESNSIMNQFVPLVMNDFVAGIPALLAGFAPLLAPVAPINVHQAKVAVSFLPRAISNPGPTFPVIDGLCKGFYICQVKYTWRGCVVVVPIFRLQ